MERMAEDLKERIAAWGNHDPNAWTGATWLFQGAPGAGKTALLSRLGSLTIRPTGDGDNSNGEPVGVNVCLIDEEAALHNPAKLKKKIAEAFLSGAAREMEGRESVGSSLQRLFGRGICRGHAEGRHSARRRRRISVRPHPFFSRFPDGMVSRTGPGRSSRNRKPAFSRALRYAGTIGLRRRQRINSRRAGNIEMHSPAPRRRAFPATIQVPAGAAIEHGNRGCITALPAKPKQPKRKMGNTTQR